MSYSKQIKTIAKMAEDIVGFDSNQTNGQDFVSVAICPMENDYGFQVWVERSIPTEDRGSPHMKLIVHNGVQFLEEHKNLDDALKALSVKLENIREQAHPTYITIKGVQYVRADK